MFHERFFFGIYITWWMVELLNLSGWTLHLHGWTKGKLYWKCQNWNGDLFSKKSKWLFQLICFFCHPENWGRWTHFDDRIFQMDVSENSGTPRSSILIGFSIINHPFWDTPIFGNTQMGLEPPTCHFVHQEIPPWKLRPEFHEVKKLFQTMDFSGDGAINLQDGFLKRFPMDRYLMVKVHG